MALSVKKMKNFLIQHWLNSGPKALKQENDGLGAFDLHLDLHLDLHHHLDLFPWLW